MYVFGGGEGTFYTQDHRAAHTYNNNNNKLHLTGPSTQFEVAINVAPVTFYWQSNRLVGETHGDYIALDNCP